jgi:hypothetical protein
MAGRKYTNGVPTPMGVMIRIGVVAVGAVVVVGWGRWWW